MADLHDERIRELENILLDAPEIAWRFDCGNWPGSSKPLMPAPDRIAAGDWLHRVYAEKKRILAVRG